MVKFDYLNFFLLFVQNVNHHGNGSANSCSGITLIVLFITMTVGNVVWIVYQFIEFSGCGGNIAIMVITCVLALIFYGVVLLRTREVTLKSCW